MAFVDENAENPNVAQPAGAAAAQGQQPVAAGGAGVGGTGGNKAASTPGINVPAQPSAQLSAYLNANQPQAAQFAGQVANTLSGQNAAIGSAIQPAVNTYTGSLYNVPSNADLNAKVASSPSSLSPEEQAGFKTQLGAAAKAPNSANTFETSQGYQDLSGQIQNAVGQANLWNSGNSIPNISSALQPFEAAGTSSGNTTLDALLLSQSPGAYSQIQNAVAPAAGFQAQLGAGASQANQALKDAIANDLAASQGANQSAGKFVSGLNQNLADYLKQSQTGIDSYNAGLNNTSTQEANALPLLQRLQSVAHNFDYNNPMTPAYMINVGNPAALPGVLGSPNTAQVATPQNYSDIAALESLLGPEAAAALNPAINSSQSNLAGTAPVPGQVPGVNDLYSSVLGPAWTDYFNNTNYINPSGPLAGDYSHVGDALTALSNAVGYNVPLPPPNLPGGPVLPPPPVIDPNAPPPAPSRFTTNV